jgi:hypothetical protein
MNALQANDYNQTVSAKVASYTLVAADKGTRITMSNAAATTITVNTSLFAAGDSLRIQNIGAGACTITAGTATVTSAGPLSIPQWGGGQLFFTSASAAVYFPDAITGKILQVVSATSVTAVSTTGSTFVTSGLTATITPSSTSSKIYVVATVPIKVNSFGLCGVTLFRGTVAGTNLATGAALNFGYVTSAGGEIRGPYALNCLDSPSTVSAQVYTVGIKTDSTNTIEAMNNGSTGTITLMEVSA